MAPVVWKQAAGHHTCPTNSRFQINSLFRLCVPLENFQPGQVIWDLAWWSAETPGPTARWPGGIKVWSRYWTDQPGEGGDEPREPLSMERRARVWAVTRSAFAPHGPRDCSAPAALAKSQPNPAGTSSPVTQCTTTGIPTAKHQHKHQIQWFTEKLFLTKIPYKTRNFLFPRANPAGDVRGALPGAARALGGAGRASGSGRMLPFESAVGWRGLERPGASGECRPWGSAAARAECRPARGQAGRSRGCGSCRGREAGAPSFAVRGETCGSLLARALGSRRCLAPAARSGRDSGSNQPNMRPVASALAGRGRRPGETRSAHGRGAGGGHARDLP